MRKLRLPKMFDVLVGTAMEQFPIGAWLLCSRERREESWTLETLKFALCFYVDLVIAGSLTDSVCVPFTLALCLYSKDVS